MREKKKVNITTNVMDVYKYRAKGKESIRSNFNTILSIVHQSNEGIVFTSTHAHIECRERRGRKKVDMISIKSKRSNERESTKKHLFATTTKRTMMLMTTTTNKIASDILYLYLQREEQKKKEQK